MTGQRRHLHHGHHPHASHQSRTIERFLLEPDWPLREVLAFAHHLVSAVEGIVPVIAGLALTTVIAVTMIHAAQLRRLPREARLVRIGVPPEVDTQGALMLWSALHDLLRPPLARLFAGQPHLAWEIAASDAGTTFRLWVPKRIPEGLIERAVCSAWPGASITIDSLPTQQEAFGYERLVHAASELVLSGPDWFSLNAGLSPDPLPLILGQLSGLEENERALIQVLARPATIREQRRLRAAARRIRAGIPTSRLSRLIDFWRSTRAPAPPRHDPTIAPDVRDVMTKSEQLLYRCLIRVSVTARSRALARGRIHAILGGFAAYEGRVGLRRRHAWRAPVKLHQRRLGRRAFLLGAEELAAICHLPDREAIPGLVMAGARQIAPPPGLTSNGKPLGRSTDGRQVSLAVADARQHLHILGPTGVGKSTLIANLILSDLKDGRGAVVIDPKGDLIEDLLARIPAGLEKRVDLLDPLDPSPPGLNVLDSPDRDLGVDQLVGIFRRVFERFWGPRTDDILRAALLTLTDPAGEATATLVDIPRLLSERDWRAQLLARIDDPVGLEPFWAWYDGLSEPLQAQVTGPLLNKLRAFLLRRPVRAIIGQSKSTLDIPNVINGKRLLLAKLPKGTLGEDTSKLLGSFIVARVWQAALARAQVAPEQRPDAALYVDEVHNYMNLPTPFEDIAAEARGYRLSLCLAHQHLAQLPRDLREALAANARTKIYFQLSRDDAGHLEREMRPELTAHDLSHLPLYTAAVRVCKDGQPSRAFTLTTQPLGAGDPERAEAVRHTARERHNTTREQVEAQLARRGTAGQPIERHIREQHTETAWPVCPPTCPPACPPSETGGLADPRKRRTRAQSQDACDTRPARVSEQGIARLAGRLTRRDRQIALDCYEHRVLTSEQLRRLHFSGERTARARLSALYELRVLDRFRPAWRRGEGSTPYHWVLDEAGAHIAANELGMERTQLHWRHSTALAIAASAKLAHQVQVNEYFARLAEEARRAGGALSEWYGERTTRTLLGGAIIPDGYGVISLPGHPAIHLLIELDTGSEQLARIAEKATGYARAIPRSPLAQLEPTVLLLVPTHTRAQATARTIATGPLTPVVWSAAHPSSALEPALAHCRNGHAPVRQSRQPAHYGALDTSASLEEKGPAPAPTP